MTRPLRFTALMLGALDMAMAFSHLLELPAKMRYDSRLWVTLQNSLYRPFGTVGAVIENGAVLSSLELSLVARRRSPPVFPLTLAGAACQALALGIWLAFVRPVNNKVSGWTAVESAPPEWSSYAGSGSIRTPREPFSRWPDWARWWFPFSWRRRRPVDARSPGIAAAKGELPRASAKYR